jgi:hypothetical protein
LEEEKIEILKVNSASQPLAGGLKNETPLSSTVMT